MLCFRAAVTLVKFVICGVQNLSFGRPGASIWQPGGPLDDPGAPWSKRNEILRFGLGFSVIWDRFQDITLKALRVLCSYLFPGLFLWCFFGLDLDVWDWKTKYLARGISQKSTFAEVVFLMIPGSIFMISNGLA